MSVGHEQTTTFVLKCNYCTLDNKKCTTVNYCSYFRCRRENS